MAHKLSDAQYLLIAIVILAILFVVFKCKLSCGGFKEGLNLQATYPNCQAQGLMMAGYKQGCALPAKQMIQSNYNINSGMATGAMC